MKKSMILFAGLLFSNIMLACTFIPASFCSVMNTLEENIVLSGRIVGVDDDGVFLEVLDVLRGAETASTIRIWDGTDFDCNGPFPMDAALLGNVNDEVIVILPKISSMENTWDVIGDYRMPDSYQLTSVLSLDQGNVEGLIVGDWTIPAQYNVTSMSYEDFKSELIETGDCANITDTKHFSNDMIMNVNNPFIDQIDIVFPRVQFTGQIQLIDLSGQVIMNKAVQNISQLEIDMNDRASGIYLLHLLEENGNVMVRKLVKR